MGRFGADEYVGEVDIAVVAKEGGICIDCDEDRRKNGIDDGVRRLLDDSLCDLDDGLLWTVPMSRWVADAWFVLPLDAVPDLLCPLLSMLRAGTPLNPP